MRAETTPNKSPHRISTERAPCDGLTCFHRSGQSHFVTFGCYQSPDSTPSRRSVAQGRLRLFATDASRQLFESALERLPCQHAKDRFARGPGAVAVVLLESRSWA